MAVQEGFEETAPLEGRVVEEVLRRYEEMGLETESGFKEPFTSYPPHAHPHQKLLFTTVGSISIKIGDGDRQTYVAGEEVIMPAGQLHEAEVGPQGWGYVVGHDHRVRTSL